MNGAGPSPLPPVAVRSLLSVGSASLGRGTGLEVSPLAIARIGFRYPAKLESTPMPDAGYAAARLAERAAAVSWVMQLVQATSRC
jgi:hypothetical protein